MDAYYADLVRGFAARGDSVDLWVYEKSRDFPLPANTRLRAVELRPAVPALKKISFYTQIVRDLRREDYDLVIGTMRTAKQDINVNGGTHLGFIHNVYGRLRYTDYLPAFFEWKTFRQSRAIIAHSKMVAKDIESRYRITADKIHVLYPPIHEGRFNLDARKRRPEALKENQIALEKFTVFFPSTNHEMKGLDPLLEAFKLLPENEYELLIAGAALDSRPSPPKNVRYLGYVSRVEDLYVACNLTILPSRYDGFGLTVTESLACGTPVVVSKRTGAAELLGPEHGIILEDDSPKTIADAIRAARTRPFSIEPDFLQKRGLTPSQHVEALAALKL